MAPLLAVFLLIQAGPIWADQPAVSASTSSPVAQTPSPFIPSKRYRKKYRLAADKQLKVLAAQISGLASKGAALSEADRNWLAGNIQTLQGRLTQARALWGTLGTVKLKQWPQTKKKLDASIVQLNKSTTYLVNALRRK
jgi:hypothetical protein